MEEIEVIMYQDKNGTRLKIGDRLTNNKGVEGTLGHIGGVAMFIRKIKGEIKQTTVLSKFNFNHFTKI